MWCGVWSTADSVCWGVEYLNGYWRELCNCRYHCFKEMSLTNINPRLVRNDSSNISDLSVLGNCGRLGMLNKTKWELALGKSLCWESGWVKNSTITSSLKPWMEFNIHVQWARNCRNDESDESTLIFLRGQLESCHRWNNMESLVDKHYIVLNAAFVQFGLLSFSQQKANAHLIFWPWSGM